MKAGRELDALVSKNVMSDIWKKHTEGLAEVVKGLEVDNERLKKNWDYLYDKLCGYHEACEAGEQYEQLKVIERVLEDMKDIQKA